MIICIKSLWKKVCTGKMQKPSVFGLTNMEQAFLNNGRGQDWRFH